MAAPARHATTPSYAARLAELAHLQVSEAEAELLWREVARHRRELLRLLGRDAGERVALLDYLLNIHPQRVDATIIETTALDAIERRAISDALTGLYDRGYFEDALKRELQRCQRYGNPVSLLLLDLDQFKEVNDEYGHRVGDKVLLAFGELIRKHLRGADVPCRLGGDEFAIILSDTAQREAGTVAERFRADVESWFETHPVCGQFLEVTVSGGIATAPADATSHEQLYALADGALYEAKRRGSNRIETTSGSPHPGTPAAA